jgi:deazaflavin-dependent oxidoreductase (nitroreductase family)
MKTAGTPGAWASVVRHRGRRSGVDYETPVTALATDTGFVIALPYGRTSDWLKNVLAAGSATIVNEGQTFDVDRPEIVPMEEVAEHFSATDQRLHHWFRVEECLQIRRARSPEPVTR